MNPYLLKKLSAGALFDENTSRLTLARDNILKGEIDPIVIHEIRHSYNFFAFANGRDHSFFSYVSFSKDRPPIHEVYPYEYSVDELPAYLKHLMNLLNRKSADRDLALEVATIGQTLSQAILKNRLVTLAQQSLSDLLNHSTRWNQRRSQNPWTFIRNEDEKIKVHLFSSKEGAVRIYFYKGNLLESSDKVQRPVTHAVVEFKNAKIDMWMLGEYSPENNFQAVQKAINKLRDLQVRLERIENAFRLSVELLEKDQIQEARQVVSEALPFIALPSKD